MRFFLAPIAIIAFLACSVGHGQEKNDNPFRTAKVGDFLAYKMSTSFMGKEIEGTMKQTVAAKDDKEVTLKTAAVVMGNALPAQEIKVDLTKPYDPVAAAIANKKGTFEKTGEGKEKIKIGEKTYDCNWVAGKVVAEAKELKLESVIKVWFAKSVPLTGMIKMEMKSNFANVVMELSESGSAK